MKKLILVAAMVLGFAAMSFAQSSASANVTVSAAVIKGLTLSVSPATLGFGTVVAGTTPTALSAQTNGSAPMFTLTGDGGHAVTVTYTTASLTGPGPALTFTPSVYGDQSSANQATSTNVTSGSTVTLTGTSPAAGNYYFWLGGDLGAISPTQTAGSYSGTFTFNVAY